MEKKEDGLFQRNPEMLQSKCYKNKKPEEETLEKRNCNALRERKQSYSIELIRFRFKHMYFWDTVITRECLRNIHKNAVTHLCQNWQNFMQKYGNLHNSHINTSEIIWKYYLLDIIWRQLKRNKLAVLKG